MAPTSHGFWYPEVTADTLQAQMARHALFSETILLIAKTDHLDALLSGVVDALKKTVDFERCTLALVNVDSSTYRLRTLHEARPEFADTNADAVSLRTGIPGEVIHTGSIMASPDLHRSMKDPRPQTMPWKEVRFDRS